MESHSRSPRVPASRYWLTRFVFQRALGVIYLIAFIILVRQYLPLVGEHGLLPSGQLIERIGFWDAPSLFFICHSDAAFKIFSWIGAALSVAALTGLSDSAGLFVSVVVWASLWVIDLSFVNAGGIFYGFGWESILLEAGFLAIFLGSSDRKPPKIVIWLLRWVLFRVMFGAGLIKLRGDECWRNLTCMMYHYETQPIPNPLSWYLDKLPVWFHKLEVLFTHFVELVVPLGYFYPRRLRHTAGVLTVLFQIILILSGNLSWLNYMTIVLCIACFDDSFWSRFIHAVPRENLTEGRFHKGAVVSLAVLIGLLSVHPVINMLSPRQVMNRGYDPFHLVNTYGAFGSVTRKRYEVILEGTSAANPDAAGTEWKAYEFKCKPGDVSRPPCVVSPYHLRLDWQMWFAAMSDYRYHPWILNLAHKMLQNDRPVLGLLKTNPFPNKPPTHVRAELYEYRFTTFEERRRTGNWWSRKRVGIYFPPSSLTDASFRALLKRQGWL